SYFKAITKKNKNANKVLLYLTSYRAPWFVYKLSINKLQKMGYEVVVYDFKDSILDNDDPLFLPKFVEYLCEDINSKVINYQKNGIETFDAIGNSLGSFLLYNYATRYPLRKIALNMVSYMSLVIFTSKDKRIAKTLKSYLSQGYTLEKLQKAWQSIDSTKSGKDVKANSTLIFSALKDKYVTPESAEKVVQSIKMSPTSLTVYKNTKLGHNASTVKNAHSKELLEYFKD
ncbi:MAG: hypothetical protein Q7T41_03470, partial [Candidatus Saccharibacteria bacterium]|nr:hypothetical protein [Candidatus Saccharibacteria bacterium]